MPQKIYRFESILSIIRRLVLPFKVVALGGYRLVAYLAVLAFLLVFLASEVSSWVMLQLRVLAVEHEGIERPIEAVLAAVPAVVFTIGAFMFICALMLSTRVVWRHHRFDFREVLSLTPRTIAISIRAVLLTAWKAVPVLLPALAMGVLYWLGYDAMPRSFTTRVYELCMIALAAFCLWNVLPLLMSPFLAVCGAVAIDEAVVVSRELFKKRRAEILGMLATSAFGLVVLEFGTQAVFDGGRTLSYALWCARSLAAWYLVTALSLVTMNTLQELATCLARAQPGHVEPLPQEPPIVVSKVWVGDREE